MHGLLESLSPDEKKKLVATAEPEWEDPMLATLTHRRFSDPGWVYGRKLDGVRCITYRSGDHVRLMSRTRNEMSASFPEISDAFEAMPPGDYVLDGEVVAFRDGETDFQMLQPRMGLINPDDARKNWSSCLLLPVRHPVFRRLRRDAALTDRPEVRPVSCSAL